MLDWMNKLLDSKENMKPSFELLTRQKVMDFSVMLCVMKASLTVFSFIMSCHQESLFEKVTIACKKHLAFQSTEE